MLADIRPEQLFIFDIETIPQFAHFSELPKETQKLFELKTMRSRKEEDDLAAHYFANAGILAEFGKIVCISCGYISKVQDIYQLKIKSYSGHDEVEILKLFSQTMLNIGKNNYQLCGHNIKEFDVPWVCRRLLVNGLPLPPAIDLAGKKPWEVNHVDTLDLWKFGDYKHYTSLRLLAHILQVPTPKDDIDGSQVAAVYYTEQSVKRITTYCAKDVIAVAQIIMRLKGVPLLADEHIIIAED